MKAPPVTCAAPCCNLKIEQNNWFCAAHWFALPERLRTAMGATWRARHVAAFQELWTEALVALDPTPRPFEIAPTSRTTPATIAFEGETPVVYAMGRML
jgi:hypothetical protein